LSSRQAAVFVVDPHSIFRLGLLTCLERLSVVKHAIGVESVEDAWRHADLASSEVILVDALALDARAFIAAVHESLRVPAIACGARWRREDVVAMVECGAVGVLHKETLTPDGLEVGIRATLQGAGILPPDLLTGLLAAARGDEGTLLPSRPSAPLTTREEQVLRLIADGHATREVAAELCYSERTVKNVLHDVTTKLGARTRSHAVAHALRTGLIG
jgi:DNA-binding NarL/FixJ family response regulator